MQAQYFQSTGEGYFGATAIATSAILDFELYDSGSTLPNPFYLSFKAKTSVGNANCIISVVLDDVNEPPKFASTSYSRSVVEKSQKNLPIGEVITADDLDSGSELTFTITKLYSCSNTDCSTSVELADDPGNNLIDIKACSGQLFVGKDEGISYVTHKNGFKADLKVQDSNGLFDTSSVLISVIDKNDAPEFNTGAKDTYKFEVKENLPAATTTDDAGFSPAKDYSAIASTDAEDGSPCTKCTYFLVSSADPPPLTVGETDGKLTLTRSLDYCTRKVYQFEIEVFDNGDPDAAGATAGVNKLSTKVDVTLQVTDGNDAPVMNPTTTRYVKECVGVCGSVQNVKADKFGAAIPADDVVTATDQDIEFASGGAQVVTFSMKAADNPNNNVMTYFAIDSASGQISSTTSAQLDYEGSTPIYYINVTATDGCKVVGDVNCTAGTDPKSSAFTTVKVELLPINEKPSVTAGQVRSILEDASVGSNVGAIIAATDPDHAKMDEAEGLEYAITDSTDTFSIDRFTGQLVVKKALDHETTTSYTVSVTVTDVPAVGAALTSDPQTVTINVGEVNEAPVIADKTIQFSEYCSHDTTNCAAEGASVTTIDAVDPDDSTSADGTLDVSQYKITSVSPSRGCGGPQVSCSDVFYICSTNQICMNTTRVSYEEKQEFVLTVSATDQGSPALSGTAEYTIQVQDVNEEPIYFYQATDPGNPLLEYTTSVGEKAPATTIGTFYICDKDKFDTPVLSGMAVAVTAGDGTMPDASAGCSGLSCNGFTLTLIDAGSNGYCATYYQVDLKTTSAMPPTGGTNRVYKIDFTYTDTDPSVGGTDVNSWCTDPACCKSKQCTARKGTQDTGTKTIIVTNTDKNDRPVVTAGQAFSMSELESDTTAVLHQILATDEDAGTVLTYVLAADASNYYTAFDVDSTGKLRLKSGLTLPLCQVKSACNVDFEKGASFELQVFVRDNYDPPALSETVPITVTVTNVDEKPYFVSTSVKASIDETASVGDYVNGTTLSAIDVDTIDGVVQQTGLTYAFKVAQDKFEIDSTDGRVKLKAKVNFDDREVYLLDVVATSGPTGTTQSAEALITINVNDVNSVPEFVDVVDSPASVTERTPKAACTDAGKCDIPPLSDPDTGVEFIYPTQTFSVPEASAKDTLIGNVYIKDDNTVDKLTATLTAADGSENPRISTDSITTIFRLGTPVSHCVGVGADAQCVYKLGIFVNADNHLDYEDPKWTAAPVYNLRVVIEDKEGTSGKTIAELVDIQVTDSPDIQVTDVRMDTTANPKNLDVNGLQVVTLSGAEFKAPWDTRYHSVSAEYGIYDDTNARFKWGYAATNCDFVTGLSNNVTCTTAAGVGAIHRWKVTVGYGGTLTSTGGTAGTTTFGVSPGSAFTSYAPPTVTSVSGDKDLDTKGAQTVTITGTNFGPMTTQRYDDTWPDATAAKVTKDPAPVEGLYSVSAGGLAATNCKVTVAGATGQIQCDTIAGVGKDLQWKVSVGDAQVGVQTGAFGPASSMYTPPSITTAEFKSTTGSTTLRTEGDEYLQITGEDFGPVGTPVTVYYGSAADSYMKYTAVDCCVEADQTSANTRIDGGRVDCLDSGAGGHTIVTCKSAPGVGQNLGFLVKVGNQTSAVGTSTVSYSRPVITSIEGPGAAASASTAGGQQVKIHGTQFGTPGETDVEVQYGQVAESMPFTVTAKSCTVITNELIECLSGTGTGTGHSWELTVAGQKSEVFHANTKYGEPVIYGLSDMAGNTVAGETNGAQTAGGKVIRITGRNFGTTTRFDSKYASSDNVITYGECVSYNVSGVESSCLARKYTAVGCRVPAGSMHEEIQCDTAEGDGAGQKWLLKIDGQYSTSPTTSYKPPEIDSLSGVGALGANTHGGDPVTITGDNFGPVLNIDDKVTYGPSGSEYVAHPVYGDGKNCTKVSHTEMVCYTVAGSGSKLIWRVTIAGQVNKINSKATSRYANPAISTLSPSNGGTAGGIFLTVTGSNFGLSGQAQIQWCPGQVEANCKNYKPAQHNVNTTGLDELTWLLPEGWGKNDLRVLVGDQLSAASVFTYNEPIINNVLIKEGPGGPGDAIVVTLEGQNFYKQFENGGAVTTGRLFIKPDEDGREEEQQTSFTCTDSAGEPLCMWTHNRIVFQLTSLASRNLATVVVGSCNEKKDDGTDACFNANCLLGATCDPFTCCQTSSNKPRRSDTKDFSQFNPAILDITGRTDAECAVKGTTCSYYKFATGGVETTVIPTDGGGMLSIRGKYFGDGAADGAQPRITVGGRECMQSSAAPDEPFVAAVDATGVYYQTLRSTDKANEAVAYPFPVTIEGDADKGYFTSLAELRCKLPPGQGREVPIVVYSGKVKAGEVYPPLKSEVVGLQYSSPVVDWASAPAPAYDTEGFKGYAAATTDYTASTRGTTVWLTGSNFGCCCSSPGLPCEMSVKEFGGNCESCSLDISMQLSGLAGTTTYQNATHIRVTLPRGEGTGETLVINDSPGSTSPYSSAYCSGMTSPAYSKTCPAIYALEPGTVPTAPLCCGVYPNQNDDISFAGVLGNEVSKGFVYGAPIIQDVIDCCRFPNLAICQQDFGNGKVGCQTDGTYKRMIVKGQNFGWLDLASAHTVKMNGKECNYTALWHEPGTDVSYIDTYACDSELPSGGATFAVAAGGQEGVLPSPILEKYEVITASPTATYVNEEKDANQPRTEGGALIRITGTNYPLAESKPAVSIGGKICTVIAGSLTAKDTDGKQTLDCTVPEGAGGDLPMVITGSSEGSSLESLPLSISYLKPKIFWEKARADGNANRILQAGLYAADPATYNPYNATGVACPDNCPIETQEPIKGAAYDHNRSFVGPGRGETFTVFGDNFGPSGSVRAYLYTQAKVMLNLTVTNQSNTQMTVTLPQGEGMDHNLIVKVGPVLAEYWQEGCVCDTASCKFSNPPEELSTCTTMKPYRYNAPHINPDGLAVCPTNDISATCDAGAAGAGSTEGGTVVRLTGTGFGLPTKAESAQFTSSVVPHRITIGGRDCLEIKTAPATATTDGYQQCVIPPGQGAGVSLLVWVGNQDNKYQGFTYSYQPPILMHVYPRSGPTSGIWLNDTSRVEPVYNVSTNTTTYVTQTYKKNDPYIITIAGTNFGVDPRITYQIRSTNIDGTQVKGFVGGDIVYGRVSGAIGVISKWTQAAAKEFENPEGQLQLTVDRGSQFQNSEQLCTLKLKKDPASLKPLARSCTRDEIKTVNGTMICDCDPFRASGKIQFSSTQLDDFNNGVKIADSSIRFEIPSMKFVAAVAGRSPDLGETVAMAIVEWDHNEVKFQLAEDPGWGGVRPLYVATSGQSSGGTEFGIEYDEPVVSSIKPTLVPTANGLSKQEKRGRDRLSIVVTISGNNFGTGGFYGNPARWWGAQVRIFNKGVVPVPANLPCNKEEGCVLCKVCGIDGQQCLTSKSTDPNVAQPLLKQRHDQIVCLPGSAIGTDLTMQVTSQPPAELLPSKTDTAGFGANVTWSTETAPFGYELPQVTTYQPRAPDATGTSRSGTTLTVLGVNFGETKSNAQVLIQENPVDEVTTTTAPSKWVACEDAAWHDPYADTSAADPADWILKDYPTIADPYVECSMPALTAGFHKVAVAVASQCAFNNSSDPINPMCAKASSEEDMLLVECKGASYDFGSGKVESGGYFGQRGEFCQTCPLGARCPTILDEATGLYSEPVAEAGWWRTYVPTGESNDCDIITQRGNKCTRKGTKLEPPQKTDPHIVKLTLRFGSPSDPMDSTALTAARPDGFDGTNAVEKVLAAKLADMYGFPNSANVSGFMSEAQNTPFTCDGNRACYTLQPRKTCKQPGWFEASKKEEGEPCGVAGTPDHDECASGFCKLTHLKKITAAGVGIDQTGVCALKNQVFGPCGYRAFTSEGSSEARRLQEVSNVWMQNDAECATGKCDMKPNQLEPSVAPGKCVSNPIAGRQSGSVCTLDTDCASTYCDTGIHVASVRTVGTQVYFDVEVTTNYQAATSTIEAIKTLFPKNADPAKSRRVTTRRLGVTPVNAATSNSDLLAPEDTTVFDKAMLVEGTTTSSIDPSQPAKALVNPYFVRCEPIDACNGDNVCDPAYAGERCTVCAENYFKLSGECQSCPECKWCMPVALLFAVIVAGSCGWVLATREVNLGVMSIGVDYFQVLALFARSKVEWPQEVRDVYQYLSFFNVNIDLLAPECSFPKMPYLNKWIIIEFMPIMVFSCFFIVHMAKYCHKRFVQKRTKKLHNHKDKILGYMLITFYYFYLYITKTSLDIFNCSPVDPPDGHDYLEVVFEACDKPASEGGVHMTLIGPAIIFFAIYSIGYPMFVAFILVRNSDRVKEDQLLRAKDTGNSHATNPTCYAFRKRYHLLYYQFKPDFYYWILVIISRKFLIATSGLLFRRTPVFLLAFALLILFCSYALQVKYSPYMSMSERAVVLAEHEAEMKGSDLLVAKVNAKKGGLGGGADRAAERKRKMQVKASKKMAWHVTDQRKAAANAANYFWNYNSVEAVLLFCACLVLISGLMFSSDGLAQAPRKSLTYFVMTIVICSILYFVSVLMTELVIGLGLWKPKEKKKPEEDEAADKQVEAEDVIQFAAPAANPMHDGRGSIMAGGGDNSGLLMQTKQQQEAIEQQQAEIARLKKANRVAQLQGYNSSSSNIKKKKKLNKKKTFGQDSNELVGQGDDEEII